MILTQQPYHDEGEGAVQGGRGRRGRRGDLGTDGDCLEQCAGHGLSAQGARGVQLFYLRPGIWVQRLACSSVGCVRSMVWCPALCNLFHAWLGWREDESGRKLVIWKSFIF